MRVKYFDCSSNKFYPQVVGINIAYKAGSNISSISNCLLNLQGIYVSISSLCRHLLVFMQCVFLPRQIQIVLFTSYW